MPVHFDFLNRFSGEVVLPGGVVEFSVQSVQ